MWYVPHSVLEQRENLQKERTSLVNDLSVSYLADDLSVSYTGHARSWHGVVKHRKNTLFVCKCNHHNRSQSTKTNGKSAVDCAKNLISEIRKRQFMLDINGNSSWSIENAKLNAVCFEN